MPRKSSFLLLFMILLKAVYSQNSFELNFGGNNDEMLFCIKEIGNNYYVGTTYSYESHSSWRFAELVKINKYGVIIDSLKRDTSNEVFSEIRNIIPLTESEMLLIGSNRIDSAEFSSVWILKIDTLLNIIWERKFETNKPLITKIVTSINKYGNIIIGSTLAILSPNLQRNLFLLEINPEGDSLRSNYITSGHPISSDLESLITNGDEYRAFVQGFSNNTSFTNVLVIDSTLNIRQNKPIPDMIDIYLTAQSIDDTSYYLTGKRNFDQYSFDLYTAKFDTSGQMLFSDTYGSGIYVPDATAWVKTMSSINKNHIYVGGTRFQNEIFYICDPSFKKSLIVINYDSLLNTNWVKTYSNDTSCYNLSVIEATKDGGCILGGMLYSDSRPEKKLDLFILKVDSLGIVTKNKHPEKEMFKVKVYPNPGSGYLRISSFQPSNGEIFRLYNLQGILQKELQLSDNEECINTMELVTGCYFWTVTYNEQVVNGKWIKIK
ncbi:MAG: T9SS type A sorting domain-containing protein [Omnitrophica WOR_2 bacterium]